MKKIVSILLALASLVSGYSQTVTVEVGEPVVIPIDTSADYAAAVNRVLQRFDHESTFSVGDGPTAYRSAVPLVPETLYSGGTSGTRVAVPVRVKSSTPMPLLQMLNWTRQDSGGSLNNVGDYSGAKFSPLLRGKLVQNGTTNEITSGDSDKLATEVEFVGVSTSSGAAPSAIRTYADAYSPYKINITYVVRNSSGTILATASQVISTAAVSRPSLEVVRTGNSVTLKQVGGSGSSFTLEGSGDLKTWSPMGFIAQDWPVTLIVGGANQSFRLKK